MKIYSEQFGPVQYFRSIGFACFVLPYAWGIPRFWYICIAFTIASFWFLGRLVRKEEKVLRAAKPDDPRIGRVVLIFGGLMFANAGLIRSLITT